MMQSQNISIPLGLCQCGCGAQTKISPSDWPSKGYIKGQYRPFIAKHRGRVGWQERFWARIKIGSADECWPWIGPVDENGYGRINRKSWRFNTSLAHRVAFCLTYGPPPADKPHVLHKCDNPPCCNPAHHFAGTQADNTADMTAKGRWYIRAAARSGSNHFRSKVTEEMVRSMRIEAANGVGPAALGRKYGLSAANVSNIIARRHWKHVA